MSRMPQYYDTEVVFCQHPECIDWGLRFESKEELAYHMTSYHGLEPEVRKSNDE